MDVCLGSAEHVALVYLPFPVYFFSVDGGWSSWSSWSECEGSCLNSTHYRTRTCTNPSPMYEGRNCSGDAMETQSCIPAICERKQLDSFKVHSTRMCWHLSLKCFDILFCLILLHSIEYCCLICASVFQLWPGFAARNLVLNYCVPIHQGTVCPSHLRVLLGIP